MASQPLGGQSAIVTTLPSALPPMPAVARILARHDRKALSAFIAVAIDLIDASDGDLEAEPSTWPEAPETRSQGLSAPDDCELSGDEADTSWTEWQTRGRHKDNPGINGPHGELHEDDELDDSPGQYDEDYYTGPKPSGYRVGCAIADPGGCEHDGKEDGGDFECQPMLDDVPMLSVVSLDYNPFNDARVPLGISNLQTSFVTGKEVVSADSSNVHRYNHLRNPRQLGVPV